MAGESELRVDELIAEVTKRLDGGHTKSAVIRRLTQAGIDMADAAAFVDSIDRARRSGHKRWGLLSVAFGMALIIAGIGITAYTYFKAEPGDSYIITWGLVIWGGMQLMYGVSRLAKGLRSQPQ